MTRTGTCLLGLLYLWSLAPANQEIGPSASEDELKLLELTNRERKKKDLPPLWFSPILSKIARSHAENMARQGKMEHKLDGMTSDDRLRASGYKFTKGGENLAMSEASARPDLVINAWLESRLERDNVLFTGYTEVGVGIAHSKSGQRYYTQVLAQPQPD